MENDRFSKVDKFGIQLLIGFACTILLLVSLNVAFAAPEDWQSTKPPARGPYWVEKPVQCATPAEVMERVENDNMIPLIALTGNARIEEEMFVLPYGFFYNPETSYWLFIEFHSEDVACIVGVGDVVNFDVGDK
jgi:hypothetical protein